MQREVDGFPIILLDQLLELHQGLGEGVVVIELDGAVQRYRLRQSRRRRTQRDRKRGRPKCTYSDHGLSSPPFAGRDAPARTPVAGSLTGHRQPRP